MSNIPGLILSHAQKKPEAIALRYKQLGIWNSYSWTDYLSEVTILSNAFKALSIQKRYCSRCLWQQCAKTYISQSQLFKH